MAAVVIESAEEEITPQVQASKLDYLMSTYGGPVTQQNDDFEQEFGQKLDISQMARLKELKNMKLQQMQGRLAEQDYIGFANLEQKANAPSFRDNEAEELKQQLIKGNGDDQMFSEDSDYEEEEARVASLIRHGTMGASTFDNLVVSRPETNVDPEELEIKKYERSKRFLSA